MKRGFTLIEMLLSVALIGALAGLSLPFSLRLAGKSDLDIAMITASQSFRRAQVLATASDGDTSWGLNVQSGSITLFKGASYASRDTTVDEVFTLSTSITPSGLTEVVFNKFTGLPQSTGTLTLTTNSDSQTITLNAKGVVSY